MHQNNIKGNLLSVADLTKYKLSLAVVLSAVTGSFLHNNSIDSRLIFLAAGVFLLSSGAAALNQYTERKSDALMERTKNRPIPAGKISGGAAIMVSILLLFTGSLLLFRNGKGPLILGILNVLIYNLIYTYLKKRTVFSIIPGALVGAIPPMIGFASAGGVLSNPHILAFSAFMFLWQLPHFWLLLIKYGREYKSAGFATISNYLNETQIRYLVFIWVLFSSVFLALFFALSGALNKNIFYILSVLNIIFIILFFRLLFLKRLDREVRGAFILINTFGIIVMLLLIGASVLNAVYGSSVW
jgi:protoheme IX farnesyltransferase